MEGNKINSHTDPVRQRGGRGSKAPVGRTVPRWGWRAPRQPLSAPAALPLAAATWERRPEGGRWRPAPPRGPDFCSLARSEDRFPHVHVGDDLAACVAVAYPGRHPSLPPSPSLPPVLLAPLPCSKLWRLSWASWCSCSMPGGRPAARKTFTGCCHDSLVWAAFLLSRSRLEVAVSGKEQSERQAGCRPTPRRHSALIPSQVPPGTPGLGCGCVPPRQSHPRRLLPAGTRPHHRHRCCWTLSPRAAGTSQAESRVKLGKEASPVAPGDCPAAPGRRKRRTLR